MKKLIFLIPLLGLLLASCKTQDKLTYFRENTPTPEQVVANADWKIKIEPDDELSVVVTSEISAQTSMFNLPTESGARTYLVDKQGYITLPKIGRMHVAGLTVSQVAEEVTRKVAEYVEAPSVKVELENFKVSVMGEVNRPNIIKVPSERFTILDAIASAGDLNLYGRRDNVTLIREEDGKVTYHQLNLADGNIINSPYYYLRQNDVIYVAPTDKRMQQSDYSVNNSYKIQVVSAIVSGASVIVSLIIALAVK